VATVEVHVDIEDHLEEVSLSALRAEIRRREEPRREAGKTVAAVGDVELWTPSGLAEDLRTAFYARNASRFELLLTTLQPHVRTVGLHRETRGTA